MSATVYVGLGANIGDPPAQLQAALDHLDQHPQIQVTKVSSTLVNPAWGKEDQPPFNNLVAEIQTDLTPNELLQTCLMIEQALGRVREERWGPRVIDIDIIAYDREEIDEPNLTIPHPYAAERNFVINPLRQIAPETASWLLERAGVRR